MFFLESQASLKRNNGTKKCLQGDPELGMSRIQFPRFLRCSLSVQLLLKALRIASLIAQPSLHEPTCASQLARKVIAPSKLERHDQTCTSQLARANLQENFSRLLDQPTCTRKIARPNLHEPPCTRKVAPPNLHEPTCTRKLVQPNLHEKARTRHVDRKVKLPAKIYVSPTRSYYAVRSCWQVWGS